MPRNVKPSTFAPGARTPAPMYSNSPPQGKEEADDFGEIDITADSLDEYVPYEVFKTVKSAVKEYFGSGDLSEVRYYVSETSKMADGLFNFHWVYGSLHLALDEPTQVRDKWLDALPALAEGANHEKLDSRAWFLGILQIAKSAYDMVMDYPNYLELAAKLVNALLSKNALTLDQLTHEEVIKSLDLCGNDNELQRFFASIAITQKYAGEQLAQLTAAAAKAMSVEEEEVKTTLGALGVQYTVASDNTSKLRQVKLILEKLNAENLPKLVQSVKELNIDNEDLMKDVAQVVFDKAVSEPQHSAIYAKFCDGIKEINYGSMPSKMTLSTKSVRLDFRREIIETCQNAYAELFRSPDHDVSLFRLFNRTRATQIVSHPRFFGVVIFFSELFLVGILVAPIIAVLVSDLLDISASEDALEALYCLLNATGRRLDENRKDLLDELTPRLKRITSYTSFSPR